MHTTHIVKNGHAQFLCIPPDLAYESTEMAFEIERNGDEIRIRPVRKSLSHVLQKFARFSPDFLIDGRGDQTQIDRDHL